VQALQAECARVNVEASLQRYLLDVVRATRNHSDITLGVSPRGSVAFYRAVQALAYLEGRDYAIPDDVKQLAPYVLAHRLITQGNQSAQGLIHQLLDDDARGQWLDGGQS
jgi:MoxR-like ATPase